QPNAEAVKLVQKQMAELYKLVPLSYENDTLTVAMSDPNNLQAMDDLKNLLGIRNVQPVLAPPKQIEALLAKAYSNEKEESISALITALEATDILTLCRAVIHKPNGIVLVTGPTGAGKTTTLYSALSELNDIDTKIITT